LSAERDWYLGQYDSLDALVDALWTDNGWLEYWLRAMQDELLDQGAQIAEGASTVDMVEAALLARDEALLKAREDAGCSGREGDDTPSAQAQLQQDHATLEGARSWQCQAEEKAKEAEWLGVDLADKAASLALVGEQLCQEQSAR
jgi:hypothetical protein